MSRFGILISDTQAVPVLRGNFGPDAYGVRFSTMHPGGCGELSFRLPARPDGPVVPPSYIGYPYRVDLTDGGEVFWSGRMEEPTFEGGGGGRNWNVIARGYGINLSDQYEQTRNVSGVQTSAVVDTALNLAPQITARSITATAFTLSGATAINLTAMNAALQIAWAVHFGDSSFVPQVSYVYPDGDGTIRFTLAARPTTPDVQGYLQDFESYRFALQGRDLYNKVSVLYNSGASYTSQSDTVLQGNGPAGWGIVKEFVQFLPQITQLADADQAATALLTAFKSPRMTATNLVVPSGDRMPVFLSSKFQPIEPHRIRAGTLFKFMDVDSGANAETGIGFLNSFLIAQTDYDEDSHTLTLIPESYDSLLEANVAYVDALMRGKTTI